jgi:hypothetical protein
LQARFDVLFVLRLLLTTTIQHILISNANFKALIDGYQKMLDHSLIFAFSKPRGICDLFSSVPGMVVQNGLTMQGMADLYGVNPHHTQYWIFFTI